MSSKRLLSTNLPPLVRPKMAPQKAKPNPMKAAICNSNSIEKTRTANPATKNKPAAIRELLVFLGIHINGNLSFSCA